MVLKGAVSTEKSVGLIEGQNTVIINVDNTATKPQIKAEVERLYKVKVAKINTQVSPKGVKKAYVKLDKSSKAEDLAEKLKIS